MGSWPLRAQPHIWPLADCIPWPSHPQGDLLHCRLGLTLTQATVFTGRPPPTAASWSHQPLRLLSADHTPLPMQEEGSGPSVTAGLPGPPPQSPLALLLTSPLLPPPASLLFLTQTRPVLTSGSPCCLHGSPQAWPAPCLLQVLTPKSASREFPGCSAG